MMENEPTTANETSPALPVFATPRRRREVPRVKVYSRHSADCKLPADKQKDKINGCGCPKSLVYYRAGKLHRVSAETGDRHVAEQKARDMENAFAAAAKGEPSPALEKAKRGSFLIEDLVKQFVATKEGGKVRHSTVRDWRFNLTQFESYCRGRGLVNIADVADEDVTNWRNGLTGADAGRAKRVMMVVSFFDWCARKDKIVKSPADKKDLRIKRSAVQKPKAIDDEQFKTLLAALPRLNGRTTDADRAQLKSLAVLMRMTGLALRDALCVERDAFTEMPDGTFRLYLRRHKTGKPVHTYLDAVTMAAVLKGANPSGRYLFIESKPDTETATGQKELKNLTNTFGMKYAALAKLADIRDEHGAAIEVTTHGFGRHSYVHMMLENNVPLVTVAELIGDTPTIVQKHYNEWVASSHAKTEREVKRVLAAAPKQW